MRTVEWNDLPGDRQALLDAASAVMGRAYSPYSRFSVGAALLTATGKIIAAANVENAAYGSTICAERMALGRANAEGHRRFSAVAVIGRGRDFDTAEVTAPCGACRQMLFEAAQVAGADMEVILSTTRKDRIVVSTIRELLPLGFGPRDLGVDVSRYRD